MNKRNLVEIRTIVSCTMDELGAHLIDRVIKEGYNVDETEDSKEILIPILKLKMRKDRNTISFEFGQLSETGVKYVFENKESHLNLIFTGEEQDYHCADMRFFLPVAPNSFVIVKPLP